VGTPVLPNDAAKKVPAKYAESLANVTVLLEESEIFYHVVGIK